MQHHSSHHPYSSVLRQRAGDLSELAASIERSLVMTLIDGASRSTWSGRRARLCNEMLEHNLQQLHQAADDLRETAFRFRQRAAELDLVHHRVA